MGEGFAKVRVYVNGLLHSGGARSKLAPPRPEARAASTSPQARNSISKAVKE
jgi:hypothetical protein